MLAPLRPLVLLTLGVLAGLACWAAATPPVTTTIAPAPGSAVVTA